MSEVQAARYSIATWDINRRCYTPQEGLSVPSFGATWRQLLTACRELKRLGFPYRPYYMRDSEGNLIAISSVFIERTDGRDWKTIYREWRRRRFAGGGE